MDPLYFTRQMGRKGVISSHATVYSGTERKRATQIAQGPLHLTDATSTYNTANVQMLSLGYNHTDELMQVKILLDHQT